MRYKDFRPAEPALYPSAFPGGKHKGQNGRGRKPELHTEHIAEWIKPPTDAGGGEGGYYGPDFTDQKREEKNQRKSGIIYQHAVGLCRGRNSGFPGNGNSISGRGSGGVPDGLRCRLYGCGHQSAVVIRQRIKWA